jgi:hypothetical protein
MTSLARLRVAFRESGLPKFSTRIDELDDTIQGLWTFLSLLQGDVHRKDEEFMETLGQVEERFAGVEREMNQALVELKNWKIRLEVWKTVFEVVGTDEGEDSSE